MARLSLAAPDSVAQAISPLLELGAYEALWDEKGATFKSLSERFEKAPGALPSDFVPTSKARAYAEYVVRRFKETGVTGYGVRVHGAGEYPDRLRDAAHPVEVLYYRGYWDLVYSRSVAIVGTRNPSPEGLARTRKLVRSLVEDNFTIVSGLAAGVDTEAHRTALAEGGRTIAVIGTPLSFAYPRTNASLQEQIGRDFLVISQVPVQRWEKQDHRINRFFFPERNITMSALATPAPSVIALFDDLLVTGASFVAAKRALGARFPDVPVYGFFLARRALPNPAEFFDILGDT